MKKIILYFIALMLSIGQSANAEEPKKTWQIAYDNDDPAYINLLTKPINYQDLNDRTQLHYAAEKGKYNIAKALIEKGADVNIKDNIDWTPLHHAASNGKAAVAKLLIEHGANVNAKGGIEVVSGRKRNETPLHEASRYNHIEIVKVLVEHGANINEKNFEKITPLHEAVKHYESEKMVEYLISKGAEINAICKDSDCPTPFFYGVPYHNLKTLELLIKNGADLKIKNKQGLNVLEWAERINRPKVVEFLWPYYYPNEPYKPKSKPSKGLPPFWGGGK